MGEDEGHDEEPRIVEGDRRAEREFRVMMFVIAGLLAAIVTVALGYGFLTSSPDTATMIPRPAGRPNVADKASAPATSDGSGTGHRDVPKAR